jgi:hypothetical protein
MLNPLLVLSKIAEELGCRISKRSITTTLSKLADSKNGAWERQFREEHASWINRIERRRPMLGPSSLFAAKDHSNYNLDDKSR